MTHAAVRQEIIEVARAMNAQGLNQGTSGNVSARVPEGLLITPSAVPYEALEPDGLVLLGPDGAVIEGAFRPSTEWRLHAGVLEARPDVGAVLHAHSPYCTTLACLRRGIPPFHYMVAAAGGDSIRCAPYATFGTQELADVAVSALADRRACLLGHHGMLALGTSPRAAFDLAVEVEALAAMYWRVLQVAEEPALLSATEMQRVLARFEDYREQGRVQG